MASDIYGLVIPKYGMVMTEGRISTWYVDLGAKVNAGDELVDIETEKVANVYESPHSGILRRKLIAEQNSGPIGSLFGIIAAPDVRDDEIDAFVEQFQASFSAMAQSAGPTTEVIDVPAGYLRYLKKGEQTDNPVVLIHGFGGDLNSWLLNHDALAKSHAVYALDLPGHGGSIKTQAIATLDDLAAAVVQFLDAKSLSDVHLVGHSLGGAVAVKAALLRPGDIASLTLVAPVGLGDEINGMFISGLLNADRRKDMQAVLELLFHDPALVNREMTMNVLKGKRIDGAVESLRAIASRAFVDEKQTIHLRSELEQLSSPLQIIWVFQIRLSRHSMQRIFPMPSLST